MAGKITLDLTDDNDILVSVGVLSKLPVVNASHTAIKKWIDGGMPYELQGRSRVWNFSGWTPPPAAGSRKNKNWF